MSKILIVQSSIRGAESASNQLSGALLRKVQEAGHAVVIRDVGAEPLPYLDRGVLGALATNSEDAALINTTLAELEAADVVVIAAGMYNFGMPAQLKTWFDYVLQAGKTFRYTPNGPEGLLVGKRALLLTATGGVYESGNPADVLTTHVRQLLGFIGISDVTEVRAGGLALGPAASRAAFADALADIASLAI